MELLFNSSVVSLSQIGKSNNSQVYIEKDKNSKSLGVVIKTILHKKKGNHCRECYHLHNEYLILSRLNHPNIIRIKPQFNNQVSLQKNEICCLEMEQADRDLYQEITILCPKVLKPTQIRAIFIQICKAVQFIHSKNIVHNDIKLENIFVFEKNFTYKLADFGFARNIINLSLIQQQSEWKTRNKLNMSPELLNLISNQIYDKQKIVDEKKSDVWALGLALFQSVLLRPPFQNQYASYEDQLYKHFYTQNYNKYWEQNEFSETLTQLNTYPDFRKDQFIDLMNKMLCVKPEERIDINQVLRHPWFIQNQNFFNNYN